jgi:hypothetical protein
MKAIPGSSGVCVTPPTPAPFHPAPTRRIPSFGRVAASRPSSVLSEVTETTNATQWLSEPLSHVPCILPSITEAHKHVAEDQSQQLSGRVVELWKQHTETRDVVKASRGELSKLRSDLAENLYHLKQSYCRPGCEGKWLSFLRNNKFPRATADRYAKRHEEKVVNCLSEAIQKPSTKDVTKLVEKLAPKLMTLLVTPALVEQFRSEIAKVTTNVSNKLHEFSVEEAIEDNDCDDSTSPVVAQVTPTITPDQE